MGYEFFQTVMGHNYYEYEFPRLADAVEKLAGEVEKLNKAQVMTVSAKKTRNEKREANMLFDKKDAEKLYELLNRFCDVTSDKAISCDVHQEEILDLAGYIAYCIADESSFAEDEDFQMAKEEASKWIG